MKIHIYRVALIIVLLFIHLISSAPLQQNVLKYLEKDKETFQEYRNHYKFLSCKLMTYSKMKYLYEKEIIDPFVKQTTKKDDFIDALREKILDFCTSVYNGSNMEIFEAELYASWKADYDKYTNIDLAEFIKNFTQGINLKNEDL